MYKIVNFFIVMAVPVCMLAQPGTLDSSFGNNGIALYPHITGAIEKLGLQNDGKITGAGSGTINGSPQIMVRYTTTGSIDNSFDSGGHIGMNELNGADDIIVAPDDAIIALGNTANDVKLAKYTKEGKLDSSFGINGSIITSAGARDVPTAMALQPDGKIVVCGYIINEPNEKRQGFLIRYTQQGMPDESFAGNGILIWGEVQGNVKPVYGVAVTTGGQIIVVFNLNVNVAYRFNTDGSRDYNFGTSGTAFLPSANEDVKAYVANSMLIRPDGKIITAGIAYNKKFNPTKEYLAISCLNADGSKDSSFGNDGLQHVIYEDNKFESGGSSIIVQYDGKIIVGGRVHDLIWLTFSHVALARFTASGIVDSSFGDNGLVVTTTGEYAACNSAALQQDGKILLGGYSGSNYVLTRYNNDISRRQILIAKIRRWWQHHNGIVWDDMPGAKSYAVQRSSNGVGWTTVYRSPLTANSRRSTPVPLQAGANGQRLAANRYIDPSPLNGTNYYRLQTTSVDGAVAYSNTIAISYQPLAVSLSPNPAKNILHIEGLPSNQKAKIMVVDLAGSVAFSAQPSAFSGAYNLNIASLKPGNYLLRVETEGTVVTKQFVKE